MDILAILTLQEKLKTIRERKFFSIIADEGTDVSNKEQLSFCLRTVDKDLSPFENLIGFYQLKNIKSDTIVLVIKDILIRINLSFDNCRGQTYDGASNTMKKKSGVSAQILSEKQKAVASRWNKALTSTSRWNKVLTIQKAEETFHNKMDCSGNVY